MFTCAMCDFRTIYRFVMRNHIRKHTGEKFTCDVPGGSILRFYTTIQFVKNMNVHVIILLVSRTLKRMTYLDTDL